MGDSECDCCSDDGGVYKTAAIALAVAIAVILFGGGCMAWSSRSNDPSYQNSGRKGSFGGPRKLSALTPNRKQTVIPGGPAIQKIEDGVTVLVDGELKQFNPEIEKKMEAGADVLAFKPARKPSFLNRFRPTHEKHTYDWEINFSEIKFIQQLAAGNFGTVHQALWMGTEVAIKMPLENLEDRQYGFFLREVKLMASLHHPNIVTFMGACITEPNACLVMEYLSMGCVYDFVRVTDPKELEKVHYHHGHWINIVIKFGLDIARGMQYLHHRCKIIQRDLKSRNLLLDTFYNVKVCDFGLSRIHDTTDPRNANKSGRRVSAVDNTMTACGTPFWTAPEVIRNEKYNHKADVFSYAIVLYELLARRDPYSDERDIAYLPVMEIAYHVAESNLRPTIPKDCPKCFSSLMEDCWKGDPKERPEFSEVLERLVKVKKAIADGTQDDDLGSYPAIIPTNVSSPPGSNSALDAGPPEVKSDTKLEVVSDRQISQPVLAPGASQFSPNVSQEAVTRSKATVEF